MLLAKLIKKSFYCVIENPAITLFLVLSLIISNFFTSYIFTAHKYVVAAVLVVCLIAFAAVFLSGWFQVIKESTTQIKNKNFYSIFLESAGKNIISTLIGVLIYFILFGAVIILTRFIALKIFGNLGFILENLPQLSENTAVMEYLNNLTTNQKYALYGWQFCFFCAMSVFNFLMLFYFPSMFFEENKNQFSKPFIAIKDCLVFTFKNFFGAVGIFVLIHFTHFILAVLNTVFATNTILSILLLFIYIYFASISVMLIFNYYEQKTNCDNRTDCIGEDQTCN